MTTATGDVLKLKRGDLFPTLDATLTDRDGTPFPIPLGATVALRMRDAAGGAMVIDNAPVTIIDAAAGKVSYAWVSGDTNTAGTYFGEFVVVFSGGGTQTFPGDGYVEILISPEVAASSPLAAPLVTVGELERYLKATWDDDDRAEAESILAESQSELEAFFDRPITRRTFTEIVPVSGFNVPSPAFGDTALPGSDLQVFGPSFPLAQVDLFFEHTPVVSVSEILAAGQVQNMAPEWVREWGVQGYVGALNADGTVQATFIAGLDGIGDPQYAVLKRALKREAGREMIQRADRTQGVTSAQQGRYYAATYVQPDGWFTDRELAMVRRFKRGPKMSRL